MSGSHSSTISNMIFDSVSKSYPNKKEILKKISFANVGEKNSTPTLDVIHNISYAVLQ